MPRATQFRPGLRDWATIFASDTGVVPTVALRDPPIGLRGKPDYVLEVYNDVAIHWPG
ncbi:MAG: hypothetical protein M3466_09335 [Gemmatimonadota bacterium]|nr:hypothetical protein [Gemmatimonadota bacterium]